MDFYDELAPLYHLIYPNWSESIQRQGESLSRIIESEWPDHHKVLDVSCGIGTQTFALADCGYLVVGSDLSVKEIERAQYEAKRRGSDIAFSVCDMRQSHATHGTGFDIVISCDNSVPHLQNDDDLLLAFREMFKCLRPGGGCVISVRDYEKEERGVNLVKHYGARIENNKRYVLFQIWDFEGDHYDLSFFFVEEDLRTQQVETRVMRSKYYAVSTKRLCELLCEAGFEKVRRFDGAFYQPVLMGTRPLV
jgi:SAM-dependent methyltransferase